MINIIQTNLKRKRAAHDLTHAVCLRDKIGILIVGEPNKATVTGKSDWIVDKNSDIAVKIYDRNLQVIKIERGEGFVHIMVKGNVSLCVGYISPNIRLEAFERKVEEVMGVADTIGGEYIIAGDLNAKAVEWGAPRTDARGEALLNWIAAKDLAIVNDGRIPTCKTANGESYIDVTLVTPGLLNRMAGWRVSLEENLSDHRFIYYEVVTEGGRRQGNRNGGTKTNVDREKYKTEIVREMQGRNDMTYMEFTQKTKKIMEKCTVKRRDGNKRVPYWWNNQIERLWKECTRVRRERLRRRARGASIQEEDQEREQEYRNTKRDMQKEIRRAKKQMWRDLCTKLEEDIWGEGYRIITKFMGGITETYRITEEKREEIIRELFPQREDRWEREEKEDPELFTMEELQTVVDKIKNGKAPGVDGITPEIIKDTARVCGEHILNMVNRLLRDQIFPETWKIARVVLIPKGSGPQTDETRYRPICLLNVIAKVYEGLIRNRLAKELDEKNGLAENQYGFRTGRSTIQAINQVVGARKEQGMIWVVLLTFDVRNAFNEASWAIIMAKLKDRGISRYIRNIVGEYLNNRRVISGTVNMEVTAGVPQGSVLGPTLWNVMYDDVLRLTFPTGVKIVGYADDLAVTVAARDVRQLNQRIREAITKIVNWMAAHHLELAPQKTEAMVMKGPYKRDEIRVVVMDKEIHLKKAVKYLGVTIDTQGYFGQHVINTVKKANTRTVALVKLMPNIGGPGTKKREALWGVVASTLLYAAPVWVSCMRITRYKKMMESTQRKLLLRLGCAYRTVSAQAMQVVTGIPPIDLLVEERVNIMEGQDKVDARRDIIEKWQRRWEENTETSQWTKRLIQNISPWVETRHRSLNYFLTQFLTGHGSFRTFTKRIGKSENEDCIYCRGRDTPEHTVFRCTRWENTRLQWAGRNVNPDNIVEIMMENRGSWREMALVIQKIMEQKEKEEREYQRGVPPAPR